MSLIVNAKCVCDRCGATADSPTFSGDAQKYTERHQLFDLLPETIAWSIPTYWSWVSGHGLWCSNCMSAARKATSGPDEVPF